MGGKLISLHLVSPTYTCTYIMPIFVHFVTQHSDILYIIVWICTLLSVCVQHYHAETKLQSLSNSLTKDLDTRCRCGITPMFILHNPLLCDTAHPDWFIVSGRIVSTNKSRCGDIMKHLQKWAEDESKALVEGVLFAALKYCSVFLEGELPFCSNPPEPVSPTPTTEPVQRMDSSTPVTTYAIIATVVVVALALVLVLVVCIVTVTMLRKKAHNRHLRYTHNV